MKFYDSQCFAAAFLLQGGPRAINLDPEMRDFPTPMTDDSQTFPFFMQILLFLELRAMGFYTNWIQFVENKHSEAHGIINMANTIQTEIWSVCPVYN